MSETRNILILGASYAGLGAAHYFLKHVYPSLPKDQKASYKVILVNASSKWLLRHATPRAAVSSELIPGDQVFLDIEPHFKKYGDAAEFIQATARSWDPDTRTVKLQKANGEEQTLSYYALILATGSKTSSPLHSLQGNDYTEVEDAFKALQSQLKDAKSVFIAGGGPTAVETAGEIGELLNGTPGWFSSRPSNPKAKITLVTNDTKLLPVLRPSLGAKAEKFLNRVGVDVQYNTKASSSQKLPSGKTKVILHDGSEVETDVYIAATGVSPLSAYVPSHLKDEKGYVKQNAQTLRVDEAGPRVYAVGDVGTASRKSIIDVRDQVPILEANLKRDLLAAHADPTAKPKGDDRVFEPTLSELQLVPVGRGKGVGAIFGWAVPSWFVWIIKAKDFMVSKGIQTVDGSQWAKAA